MPPGFNEACYGGNFRETLAGAKPVYSASLALDSSSHAKLRELLSQVAKKHKLRFFDDSTNYGKLNVFSVYLCSSKGAFTIIDSRASGDNTVRIDVFSYEESWHPESFVDDLRAALASEWPRGLQEEDLPETTLGNSFL